MNERIQELAEQCYEYSSTQIDVEKFAELIILECEKVAKDPKWYGESPSYGWGRPIRHVCKVMKDHFGVEE